MLLLTAPELGHGSVAIATMRMQDLAKSHHVKPPIALQAASGAGAFCLLLFVATLGCSLPKSASGVVDRIEIVDLGIGCAALPEKAPDEQGAYVWESEAGGYRWGEKFISGADVDAIRNKILSTWTDGNGSFLEDLGISASLIIERRHDIMNASLIDSVGGQELDADVPMPAFVERVSSCILNELCGKNWKSTSKRRVRVVFCGEPNIVVESESLVPGMVPWIISVGSDCWTTASLQVSESMSILLSDQGSNRKLVEREDYWRSSIWHDTRLWRKCIGDPARSLRVK